MFVPLQFNQGNFNRFTGGSGSTSPYVVANLAALKALTTRPLFVEMLASVTLGDGLGGSYYWVAGDTSTADDITVVTPTSGTAGRYKLWGFRSSTLSPYPTTSTNPGTTKAVDSLQYAAGTVAGATSLNQVKIFSDAIDATNGGGTDYFVEGFTHAHFFGGSTVRGGRNALSSYLFLTSATNSASDNRNYVALAGIATASATDGGTGTSFGQGKGAIFGAGLVGVAANGAINLSNVTGCEFNVAMQTGSSVVAKSLAQFSGRSDDTVKGSSVDAMLWLYKQLSGATTWTNGILFDYPADSTGFPFDTNSTVIATGVGTIGKGVDFSSSTITTAAFKSPGFTVNGAGTITSAIGTITSSSKPALAATQTWNDGAVTFKGISLDVTNTASAAGARLLDLLISSVSVFSIDVAGQVRPGSNLILPAGNSLNWTGRSRFSSTADGVLNGFFSDGTTYSAFNAGIITGTAGVTVGAGAATQAFVKGSNTANLGIYYGTGDPSFSAAKGSLYTKTDATTTTTRLWVNTNGSTTWTNFTSTA